MEEAPNPNPNPNTPSLCEECGSNSWKYRCPGCSIRSCSLPCVKSHKERTNCTGKRSRTEIVPISKFDDDVLLSDAKFLEETNRVAESARRFIRRHDNGFKLPPRLRMLKNAAAKRWIRLFFMPPGMSKREKNQTRYDKGTNSIFWTMEWRFHSTDVVLIDHDVDEHVSLSTVIEKHLLPSPWNNQLSPFRNVRLDELKFFLPRNPKGSKSVFRELNIKAPIRRQLSNIVILEYPIIFVFLPSHSYDFEVQKAAWTSSKNKEPPGSSDSMPSPKGTSFREEEIEEGEVSSDTKVTDLMAHRNSLQCDNIQKDITVADKAVHVSDMQISRAVPQGLKPNSRDNRQAHVVEEAKRCSGGSVNLAKSSEDGKLDFEQEFRDAYSELTGGINPDDFLCLDGGFSEVDEFEERQGNPLIFGGEFLGEEELEEGEIPSY